MLFHLARIRGQRGSLVGTRDEIVCALKVMTVDEAFIDPRFEPGGQFADFDFSPRADRSDVGRRIRDRYLSLAAVNDHHFVSPGRSDAATQRLRLRLRLLGLRQPPPGGARRRIGPRSSRR